MDTLPPNHRHLVLLVSHVKELYFVPQGLVLWEYNNLILSAALIDRGSAVGWSRIPCAKNQYIYHQHLTHLRLWKWPHLVAMLLRKFKRQSWDERLESKSILENKLESLLPTFRFFLFLFFGEWGEQNYKSMKTALLPWQSVMDEDRRDFSTNFHSTYSIYWP